MLKGQLRWGIKSSLVNYVEKLEDGSIEVIEPAERNGNQFAFELDAAASNFTEDQRTGWLQFRGQVILSGHWNSLRLTIIDPIVDIDNDRGSLGISVEGVISETRNEVVARGDFNRATGNLELFLTPAGQSIFGPQYQLGQQIDTAVIYI